jgi:hypothetical protein
MNEALELLEGLALLKDETFVLEHNRNCPSPFLVRLVGEKGYVDKLPAGKTSDVLGYGKTMTQAVRIALALKKANTTFDYIASHPGDPNARIISAHARSV